ncbi:DUF481 domain-containing protein [Kordiimonas sp. SCSIO 12603]|uniref:DUF481 domain-containing protein n=1 Tax=Kordiimonas sp. SCSIO 12603 TaxID=2829596 RepID=UPI00210250EF|nr:DUF481 domain-containing protein [Kordiimonas sp. SCSIO 12603]UTW58965.1 DUF481 domain-containing protein [Kordiimonas sp. SCSIO 12603]
MRLFGHTSCAYAVIFSAMIFLSTPLWAETPKGVTEMLQKAADTNNRVSFDTILGMALETWPDKRMDILEAAEGVKPYWLHEDFLEEIDEAEQAEAAAEAASKARGFVYYVDPELWNAKIQLGAGSSTGDTNEKSVTTGLTFKRKFGEAWEHALDLGFDYARNAGTTTRQRFVAKYETLWRAWKKGFLLNYTELELDRFSGFDYRVVENIGAGVDVFDTGKQKLRFEGGPGVRFSKLKETGATESEYLGRLSTTYDVKLSGDLTLKDKSSVIFASESTTFENLAQFNAKLNSHLAARLSVEVKYDSNAPDTTSAWDTATRATLVYGF